MTAPEDRDDSVEPRPDARLPDDVEAAWRSIVANYGERVAVAESLDEAGSAPEEAPERPVVDPDLFDTRHLDATPSGAVVPEGVVSGRRRDDGEHFVPPDPPAGPPITPARRLGWLGLFAAPLVMLVVVAFGWQLPDYAAVLLVAAFVGGFAFLVATMPRGRGDDDDDGAVV